MSCGCGRGSGGGGGSDYYLSPGADLRNLGFKSVASMKASMNLVFLKNAFILNISAVLRTAVCLWEAFPSSGCRCWRGEFVAAQPCGAHWANGRRPRTGTGRSGAPLLRDEDRGLCRAGWCAEPVLSVARCFLHVPAAVISLVCCSSQVCRRRQWRPTRGCRAHRCCLQQLATCSRRPRLRASYERVLELVRCCRNVTLVYIK